MGYYSQGMPIGVAGGAYAGYPPASAGGGMGGSAYGNGYGGAGMYHNNRHNISQLY
jgi:hypothetical protein